MGAINAAVARPAAPRLTLAAALAGVCLPGSFVLTVATVMVVQQLLSPAFVIEETPGAMLLISVGVAWLSVAGAFWLRRVARLAGLTATRGAMLMTAVAHAVLTIAAVFGLGRLERYFVEDGHATMPLHQLFTLLFVPVVLVCAALLCACAALALRARPLTWRLAWRGGLAAALTFLALNVLQDLLGRRVGGPNAGATATMITVALIGNLGAAMAMSAVVVRELRAWGSHEPV
jgi:hypothetical protein